jgi:RNA polymerase primary sigma factor
VREIMKIAKEPISWKRRWAKDSQPGDFIGQHPGTADAALHASMRNVIKEVLDLTPREVRCACVMAWKTRTTIPWKKQFDVTRERIRQIEGKAMSKSCASLRARTS